MDIADTIAPKSDQINADDLAPGPRIITVTDVIVRGGEQPVDIITAETPGRAYRPSKSMRRVLVQAWGKDSSAYVGGRIEIYRDPTVTFGGSPVGGIKISGLSRIDQPLRMLLTEKRGKRAIYVVQPLPDGAAAQAAQPARDWSHEVASATTEDELRAIWMDSDKGEAVSRLITARKAELAAMTDEVQA